MTAVLLLAATLTATPTPMNKFGTSASMYEDEWRGAHPATPTPDAFDQGYAAGHESSLTRGAYQIVPLGAWVVTSTATASPTTTRRPTVNAEAICVSVGHDLVKIPWPFVVMVNEPEVYKIEERGVDKAPGWVWETQETVRRCRRCGLWLPTGKGLRK